MEDLPNPPQEAIYYEDERVYVCLASFPMTKGHSVVVWKERKEDIQALDKEQYDYLMDIVEMTRKALREFYGVDKAYLLYLDEIKHVHWHVVPRYEEKGFNALTHMPEQISIFPDAVELKAIFGRETF